MEHEPDRTWRARGDAGRTDGNPPWDRLPIGREPAFVDGKHIWTACSQGVGLRLHRAKERAAAEGRPQQAEADHSPCCRWLEHAIHLSLDGQSVV